MPYVVPISELRRDAASIVKRAAASGNPVFITQHGRIAAVLMSAGAYERTQRELEILRILARGEADIHADAGHDGDAVIAEADGLLEQS
ncbi:MAG: type II toxin-antitoxin system Phd/YefM family antitoxin [Anaerosomatales bacterium]|nr:type II toxin-antitoxin system Phd/YefM family antitoxin [Anaerosomatales bacterium]